MTGEELINAREKAGLTQQQLGELMGFTPKTARNRISHYETGYRNITSAVAIALESVIEKAPKKP